MGQIIYFQKGIKVQTEELQESIGMRGVDLIGLASLSLPLSPGFIIDASMVKELKTNFNKEAIIEKIANNIAKVEQEGGKKFGAEEEFPLTLKVVLSPSINIPSIKSIHNVGLNSVSTKAFAKFCGEDFAYGEFRYLIEKIGQRFLGKDIDSFTKLPTEIQNSDNKQICAYLLEKVVPDFPQDPYEQLLLVVKSMVDSYFSDPLNEEISTAVLLQMMTYGNLGEDSYNGTFYSRDIATGEAVLTGYFGKNTFFTNKAKGKEINSIPEKYLVELKKIAQRLEKNFLDIREIKFTIEEGRVWVVDQNMVEGKSTRAELRTLLDLKNSGVVTDKFIVNKIPPKQLNDLLHPTVDKSSISDITKIVGGIAGSPGGARGRVFLTTKKLLDAYKDAQIAGTDSNLILVMKSTYAEDVQAIEIGQGVISSEGGFASHAPVVARSLGKAAIVFPGIEFHEDHFLIEGQKVNEGDYISIDVSSYEPPAIYLGKVKLIYPNTKENGLEEFLSDAQKFSGKFGVLANAETPDDVVLAKKLGAKGVGLCRTEHMFFGEDRIHTFRELIVSTTTEERNVALEKLRPFQRSDFFKLFEIMDGYPLTVRLLDAPLHEFIPHTEERFEKTLEHFKKINSPLTPEDIQRRFDRLKEVNPMLGHRGCRVAVSYPEIYEMQVAAIFEAAYEAKQKGIDVHPEIMIPIVMSDAEVKFIRNGRDIEGTRVKGIRGVEREICQRLGIDKFPFTYKVGSMIELPAAAINAGHIAKQAEFFSFGTNDLTQTTNGLSRDDINTFLPSYTQFDILQDNPFQILANPVKELINLATQLGRMVRPDLRLGLCGEHGADPANIKFCIEKGLDYVSCSPYGIPLAVLAVAQYNISKNLV